jgi:hypothetical protein
MGTVMAELWAKIGNKEAMTFLRLTTERAVMATNNALPGDHTLDINA